MNSSDLKTYKVLANGRPSHEELISNAVQNVFPHATSSQLTTGLETAKKIFWGLANIDNLPLLDPEHYHDKPTNSPDDYVVWWLSGMRTLDDDATLKTEMAGEDLYGTGLLDADISVDDLTVDISLKNADLMPGERHDIFKDTYYIKICSHTDALATDGEEQTRQITGTPVEITPGELRIRVTVTEAFTAAFTADGTTRVSSLIPLTDVEPTFTEPDTTGATGTVDTGSYPPILDNKGTVEEDWTYDFSDSTHFTCTGDTRGVVGSGDVNTDFSPVNSDVSRNFMTIEAGMWTGTYTAGDQVTKTTHPAKVPIGQLRVIPPNSGSLANVKCTSVFGGEAANAT